MLSIFTITTFESSPPGVKESVSEYFMRKHNRVLEYPFLQCLKVARSEHPTYLPMEVCEIVEKQKTPKKLISDELVNALSKKTAVSPSERAKTIVQQMINENDYSKDDLVKQFGLLVSKSSTLVDARVLPPPKILYGSREATVVDPSEGKWNMSPDKTFHEGATLRFWSFISFSESVGNEQMNQFCEKLCWVLGRKGMVVEYPLIKRCNQRASDVERALGNIVSGSQEEISRRFREKRQLQLLVVVLPDSSSRFYGKIKRICETELGVVSQCLRWEKNKALDANKPYMENVALKINVKTGGRNSALLDAHNNKIPVVTEERTIIFGADVTHPQPGDDSGPSIAAVVASMDWPYNAKYKALVSAQPYRKESSIQDLFTMVRELLVSFQQSNEGNLPLRIIFFRDGVSEGEFSKVLQHELMAIREAYKELSGKNVKGSVLVTFIVVQKRHHTRLFYNDPQQNHGITNRNVPPGTVVDTKICHPSQYDFYLCSHEGIKGTSKPAHYHVLHDDNDFTPDLLQLFTNSLCYTYARCTRSVSIVPPVYYAHLAAFRARYYGQAQGRGRGQDQDQDQDVQSLIPEILENVKNVMYFC